MYPTVDRVYLQLSAFEWQKTVHEGKRHKHFGDASADFIFLRALRLIRLVHLIKQFIVERNGEKTISNFLKQTYLESVMNQLKLDMTIF